MSSLNKHPFIRPLQSADIERAQASVAALSKQVQAAKVQAGPGAMEVAWVGNLHIHAPREYQNILGMYADYVDCSANLRIALAEISALQSRPDVLVLGGDLTDCGGSGPTFADEYAEFARVLEEGLPSDLPCLPLLGNHDHGDEPLSPEWLQNWEGVRRAEWPALLEKADFYYSKQIQGWRFIALDSRGNQALRDRQYQWLTELLEQDSVTPTIVCVHRPFVAVGNWVDEFPLRDSRTFEALHACAAIKIVVSGHTHMAAHWELWGRNHVVFPACAYGIPDNCGWGVLVLGSDGVHSVIVKELATTVFDGVLMEERVEPGNYQILKPLPYLKSPLCSPGFFSHSLVS